MAIKFENEEKEREQKELQEQENILAKEQNRKAKKIKVKKDKNPFENWSNALLILSIIGLLYAISYSFSGIILLIPIIILWTIWLAIAGLPTIISLGTIWFSDGFRSFIKGFTNFISSISNGSLNIVEFMYKIFPYIASFFAICIISFLILKIIGAKKQIGKSYKGNLIWSIILTVLFVATIIFDIYVFVTSI